MSTLNLLITITDRNNLPIILGMYKKVGIEDAEVTLGRGTNSMFFSAPLHTGDSDKGLISAVCSSDSFELLKPRLKNFIGDGGHGLGGVVLIPLSSVGGARELKYLTFGQQYEKGDISEMKATDTELLVVISNQGHNTEVMQAATAGGATGGTVIHGVGTGSKEAEQFFGISLATEKELTLLVVNTEARNAVMESIMKNAGLDSPAKSLVFSLPVSETIGFRRLK